MFPVEEPLRIGWTDQIEFINGSAAVHANGRKYFLGLENVTTPFSPRFSSIGAKTRSKSGHAIFNSTSFIKENMCSTFHGHEVALYTSLDSKTLSLPRESVST